MHKAERRSWIDSNLAICLAQLYGRWAGEAIIFYLAHTESS